MKIQASIRALFEAQRPLNEALEVEVVRTIQSLREKRWHFESRVKGLESFAAKIEAGRVADPSRLEDFLACTIVVPNTKMIPEAVARVERVFQIQYRRPPAIGRTAKAADAFPFDDLRLYCTRGNDGSLPPRPIDELVFEVQVKTFLQHAWSIATHDLSYKTDDVSWGKDRIVSHLKAAIEHAELSLMEAENLAKSDLLQLSNRFTRSLAEVINLLGAFWGRDELPSNLRGLADSVVTLLADLELSVADLQALIEKERGRVGGTLPINLSPYGIIVQAVCNGETARVDAKLKSGRGFRLVLTPELSVPAGFPTAPADGRVVRIA